MSEYTIVVGLEVHVQLQTASKLFCGCANRFNPDHPNTQTCPVCLGLPGSLPVMNRKAFELSVKTAMSLNCSIARFTKWDRKQYYYPDLPKNYQISQYDLPFSYDGWLDIDADTEGAPQRRIGIIRAHLEEDAGKNLHDETGRGNDSQVDLNRTGTPLLEIVSQPDLRSAAEARRYLEELRLLLTYIDVSDCNMQEGSLRCDANVNLHVHTPDGKHIPTPITEVKNMNSFRNVELAIEYEARRHYEEFQKTGQRMGDVPKTTRGWDANREVTYPLRSKEEAADYRYLPDPDLVPVTVGDELIERIKAELCEFPADRRQRFQSAYYLSPYDASVIIAQGLSFADYFEEVARLAGDGKMAANWVTQDVLREIKDRQLPAGAYPLPADVLGTLLAQINSKVITTKSARDVFQMLLGEQMSDSPLKPERVLSIIDENGLKVVSDTGQLTAAIDAVLGRNQQAIDAFRGGKEGAIGPLIGQVMKEVKGADPKQVRQMIVDRLR
ncbi:MAG: Asp-tRNA(Asn)/Glu-tRNA(Gln) amidotransferase subunit GatB [Planctomycetaceae bacterium]